jgi:hypothetical protein
MNNEYVSGISQLWSVLKYYSNICLTIPRVTMLFRHSRYLGRDTKLEPLEYGVTDHHISIFDVVSTATELNNPETWYNITERPKSSDSSVPINRRSTLRSVENSRTVRCSNSIYKGTTVILSTDLAPERVLVARITWQCLPYNNTPWCLRVASAQCERLKFSTAQDPVVQRVAGLHQPPQPTY